MPSEVGAAIRDLQLGPDPDEDAAEDYDFMHGPGDEFEGADEFDGMDNGDY
jgi:hypothetical protein